MKIFKLIVLISAIVINVYCEEDEEVKDVFKNSHSISLDEANFISELENNEYYLIYFYSSECEQTRKFFVKYDELAKKLNKADKIRVGKVDCTSNEEFCTGKAAKASDIYLYKRGDDRLKFRGPKSLDSLNDFVSQLLTESVSSFEDIQTPTSTSSPYSLTDETFYDFIAFGQHFIKFYAPWCGHCQKLAPTWEELGQALEYDDNISISKIDCTVYRPICQDFEVKGYPTLLWFEDGKKIEKYTGSRNIDDLKNYVEKMSGSRLEITNNKTTNTTDSVKLPDGENNSVVHLTTQNFEHAIEKGITFVKFFAPWCGHCKRMAPTWDELAIKFIGNKFVKIGKVDCTLPENKELCSEQEVDGFPTIYIYKNGVKVSEYNGSRSLDDLHEFVTRHLSEHDEL